MLSPSERSLRARLGGLAVAARHDTRELTKPARAAFAASDHATCEVCGRPGPLPDDLGDAERNRRLEARRAFHFAQLSFRSARARSKRRRSPVESPTSS